MSPLVALAFATPIFGFSLTPPSTGPLAMPGGVAHSAPIIAQTDGTVPAGSGATAQASPSGGTSSFANMGAQLRERELIGTVHKVFGIATWASMLVAEVLGFIQYYNLYGFFGSIDNNPCVNGNAVFGQAQCWGDPWPHRIAAYATTALYATTFVLSFVMPDPLNASQGNSEHANDLRIHETLRWVHLAGMIAQVLLGVVIGENWFGLDRANNFGTLQALATVHEVIGLGTFGALTAAGAIMLF